MKIEIPARMRAVVVREAGGPEQLRIEHDVPVSAPADGEALIRVQASGVNFVDVYLRRGDYAASMPFTPGTEVVGTLVALGAHAPAELAVGDRVAFLARTGGYAEYVTAPADRLIPVGDAPVEHAMALFQGITAQFLTHDVHAVRAGESVLVHAAAGGVGTMLTQYAKSTGAFVIGTVSTPNKAAIAEEAGADCVLTGTHDLARRVREVRPQGVDVVFDAGGKPTFEDSLHAVRKRGHVVVYGAAGGPIAAFDPAELRKLGSLTLTYASIYDHIEAQRELFDRAAAVLRDLDTGVLRVVASQGFELDRAAQAHELLESRTTTGKLYLRVS